MATSAKVQQLEKRIELLEHRMSEGGRQGDEDRVRRLVLDHLRRHKSIETWEFALKHKVSHPLVERFLRELVERGTVRRGE